MRKLLLSMMVVVCGASYADGMQALNSFLQDKNSTISADFSQTVYGKKINKVTLGKMEISRPNKFRWEYPKDGQLIVGNGNKIFIYDEQLQQVTVKKLQGSLGKTPAALLAGGSDLKAVYNVHAESAMSGMEWVSLTPKQVNDNNGFKSVQIGFNKTNQNIAQMNFVDSFENKSSIVFSNVKTGIKIPNSEFEFTPPKGVDVLQSDN